nr:PREDICTED: serine/threonine-protein kinase 36 isoform X2 [Lepisosteus oculatus]
MEKYHVLEMIGEGSFGRVYKGRKKYSGQVVALKFIPKVGRSEKELRSLRREIEIMRGLRHPNVVLLLDSFETDREVVVVTEYAEGELFQILEDDGSLPEAQVREIACQLVSALYYLHSHRILHRDMKPQNILLGKGGVVKLCDFGFARAMSVSTLVLTSIKGTPLYMSPELVEEKPYDHTADLWSLGCILYELHTGAPPFYTNSIFQLVQLIVRDPVKWPESMSPDCTSFLKGLLTKDPQKRLSWPHLLKHPFVSEGILVLSDEETDSPLTVSLSPDLQALKLQQAKEKAAPHCGEQRLLRKAREQQEREKNKEDLTVRAQGKNTGGGDFDKAHMEPALVGPKPSNSNPTLPAACPSDERAAQPPAQGQGQISRDYAREFPSVEVGPRQVTRREKGLRSSLGAVRLENEEVESDEEWQRLVETTQPGSQAPLPSPVSFVPRLKQRLLSSRAQILDGMLEGACRIRQPLRVLWNLLTVNSDPGLCSTVAEEIELPHFLLDLIADLLGNEQVKQPWCAAVLGDLMTALGVCWEKHFNWDTEGERMGEAAGLLVAVLHSACLAPLTSLAASLLTLLSHHGVPVELRTDQFMAAMEKTLSSPVELSVPALPGWGLYDGLLTLLYRTVSEDGSSSVSQFLDSALWRHLWLRVNLALEETTPHLNCFSLTGLQVFLSLAQFVFTREPYKCVPLLANSNTDSVLTTLAHLLTADCALIKERSGEENGASGPSYSTSGANSVSVMTCHLLCFPFALDIPDQAVEEILQSYQRCDIVPRLLQLSLALPLTLLELPLSLLCRLLLSDPQQSLPRFIAAAEAWGFFFPSAEAERNGDGQPPRGEPAGSEGGGAGEGDVRGTGQSEHRTASSLLAFFLQSEGLSGSAVELLSLISQAARCSLHPPLPVLYVRPSLLRTAMDHPDDRVRAATCSLLGNISPLDARAPSGQLLPLLFQSLIEKLQDPSIQVRRSACRAVGNWVGLVGQAESHMENEKPRLHGAKPSMGTGPMKEGRHLFTRTEREAGKRKGDVSKTAKGPGGGKPARGFPSKDGTTGTAAWAELARGGVKALLLLSSEPDPVVRRHCCAALGNLAAIEGGRAALLQGDGPRLLLRIACTDSQPAVQLAALTGLRAFSQHDALRQALVSLDAGEKLRRVSQHAPHQRHCHWLITKLCPSVSA